MSKDFRSKQIRTIKLIGSSSTDGSIVSGRPNLSLLLYGDAGSSNYDGGLETTLTSKLSSAIGDDAWMVVSGSANNGTGGRAAGGTVAFLGDVVISGTLYSERMVVEVDSTVPGDFYVKNDTLISGSIALGPTTDEGGSASGDLLIADKSPNQSWRDGGTSTGGDPLALHGGVVTFKKLFPVAGQPGSAGGVVATITNGGDGGTTDGAQAVSRMPQDVWFHVSGAIGGRHFSGAGQRGSKRHRGVALFDGDLHTSGNLSTDGELTFAGYVNNDIILMNNSPTIVNPESPSLFISSSAYTAVTASTGKEWRGAGFMELATDQIGYAAFKAAKGTHWWVDLAHSGTNQTYGGMRLKINDRAFSGSTTAGAHPHSTLTRELGYSHRHEHRFTADGNFIMQSDFNNKSSGQARAIILSGTSVYGETNHAKIEYSGLNSVLTLKHATTGTFIFTGGVVTASSGLQLNEGDATGTNDRAASFGQQHGLMFQGSGAGRPEAALFFNSATRTNPILAGPASTLMLKMNSSQVADRIEIENTAGTDARAIAITAPAGGIEAKASGKIQLDSDAGTVYIADGTTQTLLIDSATSGDGVVISTVQAANDIIFKDSATEVFRLDASADSLLIASANPVQFRDTTTTIHSSTSGQLDIDAGTKLDLTGGGSTTDAIKISSSHADGGVDIDAGTAGAAITSTGIIDIDGTTIDIDGSSGVDIDATGAVTIDSTDNSNFTLTATHADDKTISIRATNAGSGAGKVDLFADGTVNIDGANGVNIGATNPGPTVINAGTIDVDAAGTLTIDSTDNTNLTMAANVAATKTLTISATNADGSNVSNIDVDADGTVDIDGASGINIGKAADVAIDIDSAALDIDASGAVTIDVAGNGISLDAQAASNFSTTSGDITISSNSGRVILSGSSAVDSVLIDHDAKFSGNVLMKGNLTVEGDFIKGHVITASVGDPLLLLNSGSTVSNSGGGIAIASGSNAANISLVFGRDTLHQNTILAGMKDVRDGLEDTLSDADPVLFRASGYDLGTRYASTPFITSSNPTRTPGTAGTPLSQANRLLRMHVSMSNRSTNGDILMRMDGNLIVSASNMVLKNGSKFFLNPTTFDGGPYYLQSDTSNNRLALGVGTGALWLKSTAGNASRISFDDDGKNIREISNELRVTSDEGISLQATAGIDVDGTTIDIDATDDITITAGGSGKLIDIDASGTLSLDSATGIHIGVAADNPIDIDASTLDIDASSTVTLDSTTSISIDAGASSNFTTSDGTLSLGARDGIRVDAGHAASSDIRLSGSMISFRAPVYLSENPAVGGPYYISTGSGAHWLPNKRLTFVAGRTGTFRFTAADAAGVSYNRAQVEFDSAAVFRNVSGSYFAIEAKNGLTIDGNKNVGSGGPAAAIQLSGSIFSFQNNKEIYFYEAPAKKAYIHHNGDQLKISAKRPLRLQDANRIEFNGTDTYVGVDVPNQRLAISHRLNGSDIFVSSSTNYGKITLQVSSSGAALQLRGNNGAAGKALVGVGYVSGTLANQLETITAANLDANFILSGAIDGIHDSRVRYKSKVSQGGYQRGVSLFMGDLLTSGAIHSEKNMIVSGTIATKGNLLEFTDSTTKIQKDVSNNHLKFTDANAGTITLFDLNTKVLGSNQVFLVNPGGAGNDYYTSVRTTGSFSFDYKPTDGTYTPRHTSDIGTDVYFFVSGTVGGKSNHRQLKTVAVFGGDMHISGTVTSDNTSFGGSLNTSYDTPDTGAPYPGAGAVITVDNRPVQLKKSNTAYATETLLTVSGSSALHNLTIGPGDSAADVKLSLTGSSGAMTFASNPGGGGQRDIFSITGGSGNIQIAAHASEGKLAFAQESATYIRLDNSSTPKDLQIYNTTSTGKITLKTGASAGAPGNVEIQGHILPTVDNSYNLGSAAQRFANVYTGDLHLRNERGDWTIYEEPDMLVVVNNLTGKKYKMNLTPLEDKE